MRLCSGGFLAKKQVLVLNMGSLHGEPEPVAVDLPLHDDGLQLRIRQTFSK